MKVVILDSQTFGEDIDLSRFDSLGEVEIYSTSTVEQAAERLKDTDVAIVNKVLMNEESLSAANNLKIIALTATGFNNVDFAYTKSRGITITNVAGYSTHSVVQHTFAMLFYVMEQLKYYDDYVRTGKYAKCSIFTHFAKVFPELHGKTWGILGLGNIGIEVAKIAKAFGCRVIYFSTTGKNNNSEYERVNFEELLSQSDILSIHAPLNNVTQNIMNYKAFEKMKKSAILLNLGRGPIVNEADLAKALDEELIAGAGLDVICIEPIEENNPLNKIKDRNKLLITPHIAWATYEARTRLMDEVYENITAFFEGEKRNVVEY